MLRLAPSLLIPRRYAATVVAVLLAAQLSLFAHAVGHDDFLDADRSHGVCGLCIAAQHLDNGLAPAPIVLARTELELPGAAAPYLGTTGGSRALFQARAPPAFLPR